MLESFLHYIWQFQYFDKKELRSTGGEKIEIFKPGILNSHAGPDFANAKIKMDGIDWAGSVEIHLKSSGWLEHRHDLDPAYENVVLHVVWQDDKPVYRSDKTKMPTLELKDRVDPSLVTQYNKLVNTSFSIPCRKYFPQVEALLKRSMLDRAMMQRLETRADQAIKLLEQHHGDWQEVTFMMLARNFGFRVNSEPFSQLGRSLSYKTLLKHADKPQQVEALLFGQAGFLDVPAGDEYYRLLQREYGLLSKKYSLLPQKLKRTQWRFLRMRPANFPTLRIAQFAALMVGQRNVFSRILEAAGFLASRNLFSVSPSPYWQSHYQFNRKANQKTAELGDSSIDNLLINSVAPLLVAYGKFNDLQPVVDRAVNLLHRICPENNAIIQTWKELGYVAQSAFDTQAMIELYNSFCQPRNCLNCNIGASLLKPKA